MLSNPFLYSQSICFINEGEPFSYSARRTAMAAISSINGRWGTLSLSKSYTAVSKMPSWANDSDRKNSLDSSHTIRTASTSWYLYKTMVINHHLSPHRKNDFIYINIHQKDYTPASAEISGLENGDTCSSTSGRSVLLSLATHQRVDSTESVPITTLQNGERIIRLTWCGGFWSWHGIHISVFRKPVMAILYSRTINSWVTERQVD